MPGLPGGADISYAALAALAEETRAAMAGGESLTSSAPTRTPDPTSGEAASGVRALSSRRDIERLVDTFYERVRADAQLGPMFERLVSVEWPVHLARMYAFWEAVLFGGGDFKGDPLAAHGEAARRAPFSERDFERWVVLFQETVDALFVGRVAKLAKRRAVHLAAVMQSHLARSGDPARASGR
jgi:hemoglobin